MKRPANTESARAMGNANTAPRGRRAAALPVRVYVALLSAMVLAALSTASAQSSADEYRVKAAFLFHFTQLVDWPPKAIQESDSFVWLCTFGADPFHGALETTVSGKPVGLRVLRIRHVTQVQDLAGCHVLFVGRNESQRIPGLLAGLHNAPVLTVGETDDFLHAGGMIHLCLEENKVRFEINREAAESAGLKVSSRLLILAKNVVGNSGRK